MSLNTGFDVESLWSDRSLVSPDCIECGHSVQLSKATALPAYLASGWRAMSLIAERGRGPLVAAAWTSCQ